jgi:nitric oxide reductase NorQ protein
MGPLRFFLAPSGMERSNKGIKRQHGRHPLWQLRRQFHNPSNWCACPFVRLRLRNQREPIMSLEGHYITAEPYYRPVGDEVAIFEAAYRSRLPVVLKGPTGCGKTRFVEYVAFLLGRPVITVAAHEDMTAADLAGRFLLNASGTVWQDGPLTKAVRLGAICYLDEIVEARQDTTVLIHPLTDNRRILPLEKHDELVHAHPDFQLTISYNPGYQSAVKDLKESTKQRFVAIDFTYPEPEVEAEIVAREAGADPSLAAQLVDFAQRSRNLRGHGLDEGASTRMLIHTARLIVNGLSIRPAVLSGIVLPITDDAEVRHALVMAIDACL